MVSERLPLLLVAGAPGAGKTSLLARWLADPEFAESALLCNEMGAVAIDPHLVRAGSGVVRAVAAGCICCGARSRFASALEALAEERAAGKGGPYGRLVVEACGLADPAAIGAELEASPFLRAHYRLEGVVTAVDAAAGLAAFESRPEYAAQAQRADALVVTKTDEAEDAAVDAVEARLAQLNRHAHAVRSAEGSAVPQLVMAAVHGAPTRVALEERVPAPPDAIRVMEGEPGGLHGNEVRAFTLPHPEPVDAEVLRSRLETFIDRHGANLLRVKGIMAIAGHRGAAVVQAVGRELYPVRLLARWPGGATAAVIVVGHGLREEDARSVLEDVVPAGSHAPRPVD